ncbi:MAG: hypothetical protein R3D90_07380 [Paracoccaceae bacterium]
MPDAYLVENSMTRLSSFLRSIGLTGQFLLLAAILFSGLAVLTGKLQNQIIAGRMVEGSLEIEQALARGVLIAALGNEPVRGALPTETMRRVHEAVTGQIDPNYIDRVKLWDLHGALVYNSRGAVQHNGPPEPAVLRALHGETVIVEADGTTPENLWDGALGTVVYEVYIPLVNRDGQVIAVGEIYCSVELLLARISRMLEDTDAIRLGSLILGIIGLAVLVAYAQRRITAQETALAESLRKADALALANQRLFQESEDLRRRAGQISEAVLNRIGSDLHDGPIQLLSIAALYRSQLAHSEADSAIAAKASDLLDQAIAELRVISTGLVLPALEGLDVAQTVRRAVENFRTEFDSDVRVDIGPIRARPDDEMRTAIYRVVCEALHNAQSHAAGQGLSVTAEEGNGILRIAVADKGPGLRGEEAAESDHVALGLAGMRNRARSIGADLHLTSRPGRGTEVALLIDLDQLEEGPTPDATGPATDRAQAAALPDGGALSSLRGKG